MQVKERVQELEQAFAAFNQHSLQLEGAYADLKKRVSVLTAQLAAAHSERLKQLAEKERLASRLEELLSLLPGGVLVLDHEGIVREHNPAALALLGEPLLGRSWHEVVQRACETQADGELVLASGRRVSVTRRSMPAEPGHILLLTDVTETRDLQSLVARNQRLSAMGEMAARLAHQIRTPLASAVLYTSQMEHASLDSEGRARFARKSLSRLRQLERMVNDMLVYARGGRSDVQSLSTAEILAEVRQLVQPQLPSGGSIEVVIDTDSFSAGDAGGIAELQGNREALAGALANLATNAIQAAGDDVALTLSAACGDDGSHLFSVKDNGPGLPADLRDCVFEPFFTTRPDGTGLGLAVVRSVARAHGGDVWVEDAPGGGALFGIRIPNDSGSGALPSGPRTPRTPRTLDSAQRAEPIARKTS